MVYKSYAGGYDGERPSLGKSLDSCSIFINLYIYVYTAAFFLSVMSLSCGWKLSFYFGELVERKMIMLAIKDFANLLRLSV